MSGPPSRTTPTPLRVLRVLVVDDSDASRAALTGMLQHAPGVEALGAARDGEEGLAEALRLGPDVVVLDLQMPRMDGFTFLRLLMARRPTPVVVVSSLSRRTDVFKALELGALDFVAKPDGAPLESIRGELLDKIATVRALRLGNLGPPSAPVPGRVPPRAPVEPARLLLVGASTGGPQAVGQLLAALPGDLSLAVLVAQHMPASFTGTFAERLGRTTPFSVQEAADGDVVAEGRVLVAPGGRHLELARDPGGALRAAVLPPDPPGPGAVRYVPSIDRLLASGARLLGRRVCAAVLTGMGQDGRAGVSAVKAAGGLTLAESAETAVVYGMPLQAAESGAVDEVLGLPALAARVIRFARER